MPRRLTGNPSRRARFIGYQPVTQPSWQATAHVSLNAAFETFERDTLLEAALTLRAIRYGAACITYRF